MEIDPQKYAVNLDGMPSPKIFEYIEGQEQRCAEAMTHLHIAWQVLFARGDSEHA